MAKESNHIFNERITDDSDADRAINSPSAHMSAPLPPPVMYPGNFPPANRLDSVGPVYPGSRNRKVTRRKVSPFTIVLFLLATAVAIVLYISNIIAVNQLLNEVNALESEYQRITMEQEILRAQVNRMASLERIQEKARELGLQNPSKPPVWLNIDRDKIKSVDEATHRTNNDK